VIDDLINLSTEAAVKVMLEGRLCYQPFTDRPAGSDELDELETSSYQQLLASLDA